MTWDSDTRIPHLTWDSGTRISHLTRDSGTRIPHLTRDCGARIPHLMWNSGTRIPHLTWNSGTRIPHLTWGQLHQNTSSDVGQWYQNTWRFRPSFPQTGTEPIPSRGGIPKPAIATQFRRTLTTIQCPPHPALKSILSFHTRHLDPPPPPPAHFADSTSGGGGELGSAGLPSVNWVRQRAAGKPHSCTCNPALDRRK